MDLVVFNPSVEVVGNILMISSKELCKLTGKSHRHILRDIREEFSDLEDGVSPNLGYFSDGAQTFPGFEKDVIEIQSLGERASHVLLSKRAMLILGARYSKKIRRTLVDYVLDKEQKSLEQAKIKLLEEQKAFKEARKKNAEVIMVKRLDTDKNKYYHRFANVIKPVDYDSKLQGQYVSALMNARSALEKLKEKGYEVPIIFRKRIQRTSDITGWGVTDTYMRTFLDDEDIEHEVEETMEEIDISLPNFFSI